MEQINCGPDPLEQALERAKPAAAQMAFKANATEGPAEIFPTTQSWISHRPGAAHRVWKPHGLSDKGAMLKCG